MVEIIGFYDHPTVAWGIIAEAVEKKNDYFSYDSSTERLLKKEREAFQKRKAAGVKSPENILRNTLDLLPSMVKSGVGSASTGFNFIVWQEQSGPWR